jgi:hypothetical protein
MPCSRSSAIRRLTSLFLERLLADEDFGLRVSLSDALCDENVEVVRKLDPYPEYDAVTFLAAWIAASLVATPALSRRRHGQ